MSRKLKFSFKIRYIKNRNCSGNMTTKSTKQDEWPTQEMIDEAERFLDDDIDAIYDELDGVDGYAVGVSNKKTKEVITYGKGYANYVAWRELKDWSSVFKNPGYHGCADFDYQVLCLPDYEDKPWM